MALVGSRFNRVDVASAMLATVNETDIQRLDRLIEESNAVADIAWMLSTGEERFQGPRSRAGAAFKRMASENPGLLQDQTFPL